MRLTHTHTHTTRATETTTTILATATHASRTAVPHTLPGQHSSFSHTQRSANSSKSNDWHNLRAWQCPDELREDVPVVLRAAAEQASALGLVERGVVRQQLRLVVLAVLVLVLVLLLLVVVVLLLLLVVVVVVLELMVAVAVVAAVVAVVVIMAVGCEVEFCTSAPVLIPFLGLVLHKRGAGVRKRVMCYSGEQILFATRLAQHLVHTSSNTLKRTTGG
jgi:hypothetical protein